MDKKIIIKEDIYMDKKTYCEPCLELIILKEDVIRTSSGWAGAEKDPTTDDPFVGGVFYD